MQRLDADGQHRLLVVQLGQFGGFTGADGATSVQCLDANCQCRLLAVQFGHLGADRATSVQSLDANC